MRHSSKKSLPFNIIHFDEKAYALYLVSAIYKPYFDMAGLIHSSLHMVVHGFVFRKLQSRFRNIIYNFSDAHKPTNSPFTGTLKLRRLTKNLVLTIKL